MLQLKNSVEVDDRCRSNTRKCQREETTDDATVAQMGVGLRMISVHSRDKQQGLRGT